MGARAGQQVLVADDPVHGFLHHRTLLASQPARLAEPLGEHPGGVAGLLARRFEGLGGAVAELGARNGLGEQGLGLGGKRTAKQVDRHGVSRR